MNESTRLGVGMLVGAAILGVLADLLLRTPLLGLNGFLWILALAVLAFALLRREGIVVGVAAKSLLVAALLPAAALLWRSSPVLTALDILAIGLLLGLAAGYARAGDLYGSSLLEYIARGIHAGLQAGFGCFQLLLSDIRWSELPRDKVSTRLGPVARGLVLALPLLLIFGALFMSADAVFERLVTRYFDFRLGPVVGHFIYGAFWAWIVAGWLRALLIAKPLAPALIEKPAALSVGITETGMVLGLLNVLFLAFVLVQFRYFFGGAALVQSTTGLTYADYARHGFFELVTVSALVLPVLLIGHGLVPKDRPAQERLYRVLAGALVVQLFVIMASAIQRMRLYQQEFGQTELRFYTTVFMGWLAVLFVWFVLTVLRGRWQRFAAGALVSGFVLILGMHVLNPDAYIARINLDRAMRGQSFDPAYAVSLSADAVPVLLDGLPKLPEHERTALDAALRAKWAPPGPDEARPRDGWRTWNWSRSRATKGIFALTGP